MPSCNNVRRPWTELELIGKQSVAEIFARSNQSEKNNVPNLKFRLCPTSYFSAAVMTQDVPGEITGEYR